MSNIELRDYQEKDYSQCEQLVNLAWGFDRIFKSTKLCSLAKELYTRGSVVSSNYRLIAEINGKVVGFIFGFNIARAKPRGRLSLGMKATLAMYFGGINKAERNRFIEILVAHNKNRNKVDSRKISEVMLFVIDEQHRRMGIGSKLWNSFKEECLNSNSSPIRVETNNLGASGFYEKLGFRFYANFDSPLHELATPGGQACIYEYSMH